MGEHYNKLDFEKLDLNMNYFQLPISDPLFMTAVGMLEICSELCGPCKRCGMQEKCLKVFNVLCTTCYDRKLSQPEYNWFVERWNREVKSKLTAS